MLSSEQFVKVILQEFMKQRVESLAQHDFEKYNRLKHEMNNFTNNPLVRKHILNSLKITDSPHIKF